MAQYGANKSIDLLHVMLAANIPVKLESKPGAGKTSLINSTVEASNGHLTTMVAVNHDPTDFGGIPKPQTDFYELLPGKWAVDVATSADSGVLTVVFFDEVNTAPRSVAASLLKVVDERKVGFMQLPASVRMVMAMNPAEANGGVDLTPAMANRVAHVPFDYPLADWAEGMANGFNNVRPVVIPNETDLVEVTKRWATSVAEYAMSGAIREDHFESYPEDAALRSGPFPTRRTWTLGAKAMAATELIGLDGHVQQLALGSLVGRQAAELFDDYMDTKAGMDPVAMLNDPKGFVLPDRDDALFTALDRMVNVALGSPTQAYIDNACEMLMRVGKDRPGVAASGMRNVAVFLRGNRNFISSTVQDAIREFKPVIEAAGGME